MLEKLEKFRIKNPEIIVGGDHGSEEGIPMDNNLKSS